MIIINTEYNNYNGNYQNNKSSISIVIIVLLIVIIGIGAYFLLKKEPAKETSNVKVNLLNTSLSLKVNEKGRVNYQIIGNSNEDVIIKFYSSDTSILKIDNGGNYEAMSEGNGIITLTYEVGDKKESLTCTFIVEKENIIDNQDISKEDENQNDPNNQNNNNNTNDNNNGNDTKGRKQISLLREIIRDLKKRYPDITEERIRSILNDYRKGEGAKGTDITDDDIEKAIASFK